MRTSPHERLLAKARPRHWCVAAMKMYMHTTRRACCVLSSSYGRTAIVAIMRMWEIQALKRGELAYSS